MAITQEQNTQIAQQLGLISAEETAGGGLVDQRLASRPDLIAQFEGLRQSFEPGFTATTARTASGLPLDPNAPVPITDLTATNILNPQLPQGAAFTPTLQTVQPGELQQQVQLGATPIAATPADIQAQQIAAAQGQAALTSATQPLTFIDPLTGQIQQVAQTVDQGPIQAADLGVQDLATVQGQLESLYSAIDGSETPPWAAGAVKQAQELLGARGLGASSIGAMAIASAIQESAINIAAQDAATYFQADLASFNADQQAILQTAQNRQQNMLTDTASQNAAAQFNAASSQQAQQFMANLMASINESNANRLNNMSQFNAQQANQVEAANAGNQLAADQATANMQNSINQFNSGLQNQRDQFNSNMQFAIDQSNVLWRRQVNTTNTALSNSANQANVQNLFNLSATSMNNLWQQWRDESAWAFTAQENSLNREFAAYQAANDRQSQTSSINSQSQSQANAILGSLVGGFASSLF